jgi:hypothetical protein
MAAVLAVTVLAVLVAASSAAATPTVSILPGFSESHLGEGGILTTEIGFPPEPSPSPRDAKATSTSFSQRPNRSR